MTRQTDPPSAAARSAAADKGNDSARDVVRHPTSGAPLSPAAQRALDEAAERHAARSNAAEARPSETNGPKGPEPTRYGDWEKGGIASDF